MMNAQEIIAYIGSAEKKTPVKAYVNEKEVIDYGSAVVFGEGASKVVFGDWRELGPVLEANAGKIKDLVVENDRRNSAIPMLDLRDYPRAGGNRQQCRHYDGRGHQYRCGHWRGHHD